jgi:hypothetical protein
MTLSTPEPTRKQRFNAALQLAGMTQREWLAANHAVGVDHLYRVLMGERTGAPELEAAIDGFIAKYLPDVAA